MPILLKVEWVGHAEAVDGSRRVAFIGGNWAGSRWRHTAENAVIYIDGKSFSYYIQNQGRPMNIIVAINGNGAKHLATREDTVLLKYLMDMPEPPVLVA